jgi:hypothetical protein
MRVTKSVTVRGSRSPQIRPGGCYRITLAAYLGPSLLITSTIPEYQVERELCRLGVQDLAAISLDGRIPPGAEERGVHLSPGRILGDPAPGSASSEVNANNLLFLTTNVNLLTTSQVALLILLSAHFPKFVPSIYVNTMINNWASLFLLIECNVSAAVFAH